MREIEKLEKDNSDFRNLLSYEPRRYKERGFGLIAAILIAASFIYYTPLIAKLVYPKEVEHPGKFFYFITISCHGVSLICANLLMLIVYKLKSPFFEKYKTTANKWPWDENYSEWIIMLKKTIKLIMFNHFVAVPLFIAIFYIFDFCHMRTDYETLPNSIEILLHLIFFAICEDFFAYLTHRFLHSKWLYPHIHKVHHTYKQVVSICSEYVHPLEFLFSNSLTTITGSMILGKRSHLFTFLLWLIMSVFESVDQHCGYDFSWSPYRILPFSTGEDFHNYHHVYFNDNYGTTFTIWD